MCFVVFAVLAILLLRRNDVDAGSVFAQEKGSEIPVAHVDRVDSGPIAHDDRIHIGVDLAPADRARRVCASCQ